MFEYKSYQRPISDIDWTIEPVNFSRLELIKSKLWPKEDSMKRAETIIKQIAELEKILYDKYSDKDILAAITDNINDENLLTSRLVSESVLVDVIQSGLDLEDENEIDN